MIQVNHLSKFYGNKPVIDDVSLTIEKGTITSLIGPNGAGKSTVLSCMSRLLQPDKGDVLLDGQRIDAWKPNDMAKRLSILKQSNELNIRLTVRDLVAFGRFPYSKGRLTPEDDRQIDAAIDYLELAPYAHRYLDQLSGGQRQRAYIAMVLAQNTDYILLDEPLNNLDMRHAVQIMKVLRKMVDDLGKTIVLVIHDINFASRYSDQIIALKNGRVLKADTPDGVIDTDVLRNIYDMDITVQCINDCKICTYYE